MLLITPAFLVAIAFAQETIPDPDTFVPVIAADERLAVTAPPQARLVLDEATTLKRETEVLATVDRAKLQAEKRPVFGLEVAEVSPGGQAEAWGLKPGDLLVSLDGKPFRSSGNWPAAPKNDVKLTWWSPITGAHDVVMPQGKIGISHHNSWRPDLAYIRQPHHGAFDDHMYAALFARSNDIIGDHPSDPELVESALALAQKGGVGKSYLAQYLLASAALDQGRFDEAISSALAALSQAPPAERTEIAEIALRAAKSSRRYALARQLTMVFKPNSEFEKEGQKLLAASDRFHSRHAQAIVDPDPLSGEGTDVAGLIGPDASSAISPIDQSTVLPFSTNELSHRFVIGPEQQDAVYSGTITFAATVGANKAAGSGFGIELVSQAGQAEADVLVEVKVWDKGFIRVQTRDGRGFYSRPACRVGADVDNRFRIAVFDDAFVIELNGQRVYLGEPAVDQKDRHLYCRISLNGITGKISDLSVHHLTRRPKEQHPGVAGKNPPKPNPAAPPAATPPATPATKPKVEAFGKVLPPTDTVDPREYDGLLALANRRFATITDDPDQGLLVEEVIPGGRASRLGIRPDDVLVKLDGKRINDTSGEMTVPPGKHRLDTWSSVQGQAGFNLEGGALGVVTVPHRSGDAESVRIWHEAQDGPWKEHLRLAILMHEERPEVAESALARCIKLGYQGHLLQTLRAVILANLGRYEDALAVGIPQISTNTKEEGPALMEAMDRAAIASHRLSVLAMVHLGNQRENKDMSMHHHGGDVFEDYAAAIKEPGLDGVSSLADFCSRWAGYSSLEALPQPIGEDKDALAYLTEWKANKRQRISIASPRGSSMEFRFGPHFGSGEATVQCTVFANEYGDTAHPLGSTPFREFNLGIRDFANDPQGVMLIELHRRIDGKVLLLCRGHLMLEIPMPRLWPTQSTEIHLVVLGDECAAFVDHRCLAHLKLPPMPGIRMLGVEQWIVGIAGRVTVFRWASLTPAVEGGSGTEVTHRAGILQDCGRPDEGDALVEQALAKDPAVSTEAATYFWKRDLPAKALPVLDLHTKRTGDVGAIQLAAAYQLLDPATVDSAIETLNKADVATSPLLFTCATNVRRSACQGKLLPMVVGAAERSPYAAMALALLQADTGDFEGADRTCRKLLGHQPGMNPTVAGALLVLDRILAPMFKQIPLDESVLDSHNGLMEIEDVNRLLLAWLDGKVDDAAAEARALRDNEARSFFYFRALQRLSLGQHYLARQDLEFLVKVDPTGEYGGGGRSLLAWYAKQTAESLAALPKATPGKRAQQADANDF